jgi:hypothetical protein
MTFYERKQVDKNKQLLASVKLAIKTSGKDNFNTLYKAKN